MGKLLTRHLPAGLIACLALAPAAAAAPQSAVALTECRRALDPELRLGAFEGRMKRVAGSERMQMRFTLFERAEGRWSPVEAEGWDAWVSSDPGVAEYRYTREVGRLAAPAVYRTVVRFRWLDAQGKAIARRRAVSRRCRQPDLRPDLEVRRVVLRDGRYRVTLRNTGRTRAAASEVSLSVDAGEAVTAAVRPIRARGKRRVWIEAPRCSPGGEGLSLLADSGYEIDERDEADNGFARNCPLARR